MYYIRSDYMKAMKETEGNECTKEKEFVSSSVRITLTDIITYIKKEKIICLASQL